MFLSFSIMPGCTTSTITMMNASASITVPAVSDAATRSARSSVCAERDGAGSGKYGNENAKSQRTAELVSNIDKPGGSARIFFRDTNDTRGGERGKGGTLTDTDEDHRECYAGHVRESTVSRLSQNIPTRVMKSPLQAGGGCHTAGSAAGRRRLPRSSQPSSGKRQYQPQSV